MKTRYRIREEEANNGERIFTIEWKDGFFDGWHEYHTYEVIRNFDIAKQKVEFMKAHDTKKLIYHY